MQLLQSCKRLLSWAQRRRQPQPLRQTLEGLCRWQKTPLAQAILAQQSQQLDGILSDLFGYHLMELSSIGAHSVAPNSRISHRFRLSPLADFGAQAVCELERLPLDDESVDVAIMHHILDYTAHPHQVLREVNRVLIARGTVIIVGFNPVSLQGIWRFVCQWFSGNSFWRRHSLRAGRVMDWLRVLDCEPVALQRGFYRPPVNHERILSWLHFLESLGGGLSLPFGGYYILVARKERVCLRPIKPVWEAFNPVAGFMAKPTPRLPQAAGQHQLHSEETTKN